MYIHVWLFILFLIQFFFFFLERNIKVDVSLSTPRSPPSSNGRPFVPPHPPPPHPPHPHPPHSPHPPPHPQPVIVDTLLRESSHSSTSTSRTDQSDLKPKPSLSPPPSSSLHPPLSHETTPTQILSYEDVKKATGDFDNVLFSEGGHKLGEGGFGIVYQGQINLGEGNREVAVKVFVDDVSFYKTILKLYFFILKFLIGKFWNVITIQDRATHHLKVDTHTLIPCAHYHYKLSLYSMPLLYFPLANSLFKACRFVYFKMTSWLACLLVIQLEWLSLLISLILVALLLLYQ